MKVAVIGAGRDCKEQILRKSLEIGKEIARRKWELLMGGCRGYPHEAAKGAFSGGGKVLAFSPAVDQDEHIKKYNFPLDSFTTICYTGLGIPRRNYPLVSEADAVIMIGGQIGSLNEFTIAFHLQKRIGVLAGSGGVVELIEEISRICDKKGESKNIVYSEDAKELVDKLI
ncbi:MAG TPA: hypothetical protein VJI46_03535 [Candidatus Nanoarchaeia archaeon]|nr:hypothetical protein [Candidatus Nanoarchaeia archaeon]